MLKPELCPDHFMLQDEDFFLPSFTTSFGSEPVLLAKPWSFSSVILHLTPSSRILQTSSPMTIEDPAMNQKPETS
jgi:hypothetical protein